MNVKTGTPSARGKRIVKSKLAKYRSGLERKISVALKRAKVTFEYETEFISFVSISHRRYKPDFIVYTKSGKKIYIEAKGLWDADDRRKHLLIKQQHPDKDIRFVFSNSKTKIRKGSQTSYADICNGLGGREYKGLTWLYADKKIPKEWLDE